MPGFKKTIQSFNPQGFWTFDGEDYDGGTRLYTDSPVAIIDESDVGNNGILQIGIQEPEKSYKAGIGSLVELEPASQNSIGFGTYGKVKNVYPKAFVQIPNVSDYNTGPNNGSFTFLFMYRKITDESDYRSKENDFSNDLSRPILRKKDTIVANIVDRYLYEDMYSFEFPIGVINVNRSKVTDFYGGVQYIVLRFKVYKVESSSPFEAKAEVIINGEVLGTLTKTFQDVPPNTFTNNPIEIGGYSEVLPVASDRNTSAVHIDQVAFFTRALKDVELYRLLKKIWLFHNLLLKKNPTLYIPFQDDDFTTVNEFYIEQPVGGIVATHVGTIGKARIGPDIFKQCRAVAFYNAMAVIRSSSNYAPFNIDPDNHAFEMFFKTGGSDRGVMVSMQGIQKPFGGPLLEINVDDKGNEKQGWISYTENEAGNVACDISEKLNDGDFHHIVVQRREIFNLDIILDGKLIVSKKIPKDTMNNFPSYLTLMGSMPGKLYCNGELSHFAFYNGKTFTPEEATTRASYHSIYRVRGHTTLRGIPYRAQVRFYDYTTGKFIDEIYSNMPDGDYENYLLDNSRVNIMVAGVNDVNVRVRAFGPLMPAEIEDPPD